MPVARPTVATSNGSTAGAATAPGPKSQQGAHLRDSRNAVGRRHLLYELERHAFEASPLTQLFTVLAKRRPSWWSSSDEPGKAVDNTNATVDTTATSANQSSHRKKKATDTTAATADDTASAVSTSADPTDPSRELFVPDTVVWETNIPKGWFSFDRKERHVLRRKVETKAIQRAFLRGAKYADDVVAVLYSANGTADTGEPALQFQFITAAGLEGFLFEHGRGKGTAILQQFVPSLHAAHNDCIEAVWSPTVCHVSRRQNIHEIADDRYDVNDRCVTFEAKTHLSRLVQCTSRLRAQVKGQCENLVRHFHGCDTRHVVTRLVCRFKMSCDSELTLLHCVSARVMRAAAPSAGPTPASLQAGSRAASASRGASVSGTSASGTVAGTAVSRRGGGGNAAASGSQASHVDEDLAAATRADDGTNSVFYRQYRVALDIAVRYEQRPPPAVTTGESRSVLSRLQERNERLRHIAAIERRQREEAEDAAADARLGVGQQPTRSRAATPAMEPTPTGKAPSVVHKRPSTAGPSAARRSRGGGDDEHDAFAPPAEQHRQADVTVAGQLASRRGFVVRPTRTADRQASLPDDSAAKARTSASPSPNGGVPRRAKSVVLESSAPGADEDDDAATLEAAAWTLVTSPDFEGFTGASAAQQRKVSRVLDRVVRHAGAAAVRRALLQAHEDDLTDCEKMELLGLLMAAQQQRANGNGGAETPAVASAASHAARLPRTWRRTETDRKAEEALAAAAESPKRQLLSDEGEKASLAAWALVRQAVDDATYPAYNDADGGTVDGAVRLAFPSCPAAASVGPAHVLHRLAATCNDAEASALADAGHRVEKLVVDALADADGDHGPTPFAGNAIEAAAIVVLLALQASASCKALRDGGFSCTVGPPPHCPVAVSVQIPMRSRAAPTRICQRLTFACGELVTKLEAFPLKFSCPAATGLASTRATTCAPAPADAESLSGDNGTEQHGSTSDQAGDSPASSARGGGSVGSTVGSTDTKSDQDDGGAASDAIGQEPPAQNTDGEDYGDDWVDE